MPQSGLPSDPVPHRTHPTVFWMPHDFGVPMSGGATGGAAVGAGGKTGVGGGGAGVGEGGSSGQVTSPHPSGSVEQLIWSALGPEHDALHVSMMKLHKTHTVEFGMWMGFETMVPGGHAGSGVGMPMPAETGTMPMLTMASAVRAKDTRDEGIIFILQNKRNGVGWKWRPE